MRMRTPTLPDGETGAVHVARRYRGDARVPRIAPQDISAALAVPLAVALVLLDLGTWIELNVAMGYSLPLVFAAASRRPRLLWTLTAALVAATFLVYRLQVAPAQALPVQAGTGLLKIGNPYLVDRTLAALTVLLTAAILQGWLLSLRGIELRDAYLERVNEELRRQREEIALQNAELERRRREVEEISSRKTRMLASISHDIRTPLQSITLVAEVMRRTAGDAADAGRMANLARRLQSHALSVAELLSEVIDLASFEQGKAAIHPSEFALVDLLQEQCQRLAPQAEAKGLALRVGEGPQALRVCTDRAKLGRIVANLVSNAIKFTSAGGVTLSCAADAPGRVRIEVADTGCGIQPGQLPRIFGEFCQEDPGAAQSGSGWGLGLAICRRLAGLLGGELQARSEPGRGSTFVVVLPVQAPPR